MKLDATESRQRTLIKKASQESAQESTQEGIRGVILATSRSAGRQRAGIWHKNGTRLRRGKSKQEKEEERKKRICTCNAAASYMRMDMDITKNKKNHAAGSDRIRNSLKASTQSHGSVKLAFFRAEHRIESLECRIEGPGREGMLELS